MTIRKRKNPTPHFKLPPPFEPITGERAPLVVEGKFPYCAMMQIAVADTYDDYVICRGYDPRHRRFFDYVAGDADKVGIPVAKPYGIRGTNPYTVGEMFPAVIPITKLGDTSGVAADTTGHPADLDEVIGILYNDAASLVVEWLLLDSVTSTFLLLYEITTAGVHDSATTKEWYYEGKTVLFDTDTNLYTVQTGESAATLWHPLALREDLTDDSPSDEAAETMPNFYVGQRVYVTLRAGRYEIVSPALDEWRFEMKDDVPSTPGAAIAANQTGTAYPRWWTGAAYVTDTTIEIEVYDVLGVFRARGRAKYSSPHADGSFGIAKYWPDSNRWEITELTPHALMIRGQATANWTAATFAIDTKVVMQPSGSIITTQDPASNVTVYDIFNWDGSINDDVVAVWNENNQHWEAIQITCPA